MHVVDEYSHRHGREALEEKELGSEIRDLVDVREIGMARGRTKAINDAVKTRLSDNGWALDSRVHANFRLDINGLKKPCRLDSADWQHHSCILRPNEV